MEAQETSQSRKTLFFRLGAIVFFGELAHGMLLYGIVPELASKQFSQAIKIFGVLPVRSVEIAGYSLAAFVLAELLFKLAAGHAVDEHGPDGPLRAGLFLSLVTVPLILLSKNPYLMLGGAFLHGLGAAPIWPAVISAWTRGRSSHERGEVMGQILTAWMAGLGLGVILGNVLVGLTGRQELVATFSPVALWLIPVAAAFWGGERLGYPARHGKEDPGREPAGMGLPPELWVMAIGLFVQNLAFGNLILPFRETATSPEHLALNPAQYGLMILLGGGPAVVLLGPMGKLADRIGRRNAVIYAMLVVAPLILSVPFLSFLHVSPWARFGIMIPGLLLAGVAYAFLLPAWHALALGRIPEQQRGKSLALLMSIEMVALGCGHVVGPTIYAKVRFWAPFVLAGVTFAILAIIYMLGYILPRELPEEPHPVDLNQPGFEQV
jgi:MFS family permease